MIFISLTFLSHSGELNSNKLKKFINFLSLAFLRMFKYITVILYLTIEPLRYLIKAEIKNTRLF